MIPFREKAARRAREFYERRQIRHLLLTDVCPLATGGCVFAFLPHLRPQWLDFWLSLVMWWVSGIGVTVGFHRLFTHRAFQAQPAIRMILGLAGTMAAVGPLIAWVATHRKHHQSSDQEGDPHSPNLSGNSLWGRGKGLLHSQVGWLRDHEFPSPLVYARDLLGDSVAVAVNRNYLRIVVAGVLLPGITALAITQQAEAGIRALVWAGMVRIAIVHQIISSVNSICHSFGTRPFDTQDRSRNNAWLAVPTVGESWHNNHHRFPSSAYIGLKWWEIDPGGWIVTILRWGRMIWDVKDARSPRK